MTVLNINRVLNCVLIFSDSCRTLNCPTKELNGELFFHFKKEWHPVAKYLNENTIEFVKEDGNYISRLVSE